MNKNILLSLMALITCALSAGNNQQQNRISSIFNSCGTAITNNPKKTATVAVAAGLGIGMYKGYIQTPNVSSILKQSCTAIMGTYILSALYSFPFLIERNFALNKELSNIKKTKLSVFNQAREEENATRELNDATIEQVLKLIALNKEKVKILSQK